MIYSIDDLRSLVYHIDRRLKDSREYSDIDIQRLLQDAIRNMCAQIQPFMILEEYTAGSGYFMPEEDIIDYSAIGYYDTLREDPPLAPEYTINNDKSVTVDEGSGMETGYGPLVFHYWYVPNISTAQFINIGDYAMQLFELYLRVVIYRYMKDDTKEQQAKRDLTYAISNNSDTGQESYERNAASRGFV